MLLKRLSQIVLCFLIFNSPSLYAQNDFQPGGIVLHNGDTVQGLVNYKSVKSLLLECSFKVNNEAEVKQYNPDEIKGYFIDNEKYFMSKKILYEGDSVQVFLEYLVNGIVSLYYLNVGSDGKYFLEDSDGLTLLSNDSKIIEKDGKKYEVESNSYKATLILAFGNNKEMNDKIHHTPFQYKSLVNLTKDYHHLVCDDFTCIDYTKQLKSNKFIEPYLGLKVSSMTLTNSSDHLWSVDPLVGVRFRVSSVRWGSKWNFFVGVHYTTDDFNGLMHAAFSSVGSSDYLIDLQLRTISVPIGVEYAFSGKKLKPFIRASYNNVFVKDLSEKALQKVYINADGSIINQNTYLKLDLVRPYNIGVSAGIGLRYDMNEKNSLNINSDFEMRMSYINTNYFFDFIRVYSGMFTVSYLHNF